MRVRRPPEIAGRIVMISALFVTVGALACGYSDSRAIGPQVDDPTLRRFSDEFVAIDTLALPELLTADVNDVAVTPDGTLLVADNTNRTIHQVGPDGSALANIGRPGTAPGELGIPVAVYPGPGADVTVLDYRQSRVQRFDRAGTLQASVAFGYLGIPAFDVVATDSEVYLGGFERQKRLGQDTVNIIHRIDWEGKHQGSFYPVDEAIERLNLRMVAGVTLAMDQLGRIFAGQQVSSRPVRFSDRGATVLPLAPASSFYRGPVAFDRDMDMTSPDVIQNQLRAWTQMSGIVVTAHGEVLVTYSVHGPSIRYAIDIVDAETGALIAGGIGSEFRPVGAAEDGSIYFLDSTSDYLSIHRHRRRQPDDLEGTE